MLFRSDQLKAAGVAQAYALTDIEPDPAGCIAEAGPLLEQLATRLARDWLSDSAEPEGGR